MTYPKTKREITEAVLSALPQCQWHEMAIDTVVFRWWMSGRSGYAMRLTDEGAQAFETANIEHYEYPLGLLKSPKSFAPEAFVRELAKKIDCPYWLGLNNKEKSKVPCIRIYDDKIALVMSLYGTLREYLDSFENRIKT